MAISPESIDSVLKYYRCSPNCAQFVSPSFRADESTYFSYGRDITCYGRCEDLLPVKAPSGLLHDVSERVSVEGGKIYLPFDPAEVIENLYCERYIKDGQQKRPPSGVNELYYWLRPLLPVSVRRHLQQVYFRGWKSIPFPRWPVDTTVDCLLEQLFLLSIRASGVEEIPFIWFWPDGFQACAIMTHDVETTLGRDFCQTLMDIDDYFSVKASFQVVPEERYFVDERFLSQIRDRGFEVVVHDLNHDGRLYKSHVRFLERAARINAYGKTFKSKGFRAGVLYRKQLWYDSLEFEYDMSVPNVAHLDPQRGGCCTVMPYFIGDLLELPVTTIQDYTLFHVLNDYSTDIWEQQIQIIMNKHGLMSFIVHPDYITKTRERGVFEALLSRLASLRDRERVWISTPGEVNRWWRQRVQMSLVEDGDDWKIEGEGKDRAVLAYAREKDGRLAVTFERNRRSRKNEWVDARQHS
jgi:hypothetical protein